jgi:hypothetical protein
VGSKLHMQEGRFCHDSTGTRNSQRVDYVRKAPKHRRESELSKHRKLDIRKTENPESRRPIRDRSREPEVTLRRMQSRRGVGRTKSRRAEDPDEPQVELEGEC